jgi:hypothetical protein
MIMAQATLPHQNIGTIDFPVRVYRALIWLTLYGAALHFFDNVYFFDQYPEPAWLTPVRVALLWIPLALLAHRAVDLVYAGKLDRTFSLVHAFVIGNWLSLGHYLYADPNAIAQRINRVIAIQVAIATALFVVALWLQLTRFPQSWRWTGRAWAKNVVMYVLAIFVLERIWPSTFSNWWMR